ncbi:MAG: alpha/beta hydrolase [Candidatus Omnitrophica bacterium]|nr:alpha/beta hydrolase [Candidatus Omnitrophota bacterium]MDE2213693.1 alpha/beta hydrolase [Candidatus Omnitrophota bacterium]MDE2230732.1 alpha/beta hydrolase [Candidatus Omnitrophota bacterium]
MFFLCLDLLMIAALAVAGFFVLVRHLESAGVFFPGREITADPSGLGLPWEDVYFNARGNVLLNGWFFKNPAARSTLFFAHGNAGNIGDRVLKIKFFYDLGMNVFIFDYRGYGKSEGRPSEAGIYWDAQAAFDYLQSRGDVDMDKVIFYGASLGGAVVIDLANHRKAALLAVESSFTSARDMARVHYPFVPLFFIRLKFNSIDKVRHLNVPKLFMHSPQDEVVPYRVGEKLFMAAGQPKQFLKIRGGHNDSSLVDQPDAAAEFIRLLKSKELI